MTGGTGFLGQALALKLVERGYQVTALVRPESALSVRALRFPGPRVAMRLEAGPALREALRGIDAVVHLAGEPVGERRWTPDVQAQIRASRVEGSRALVDAMSQLDPSERPRVLLCASAIGYYGDRGDEIVDESSAPGTGFLAEVVRAWERETMRARQLGVRVAAIRLGVVLGNEGGALSKMLPVPLGTGRQWLSWIHVEDAVQLFLYALDSEIAGPLNAVAPNPVRQAEFARVLGAIELWQSPLGPPAWALRWLLGPMADLVLQSQRVSANQAVAAGFRFRFPDLGGALTDLLAGRRDHEFVVTQFVPRTVAEVFPFFSRAENLEALTPPWLSFHIVAQSTPEVQKGTLIDYRLRIHGMPVSWRSRIEDWRPGERFVDIQLRGPYRKWHHTHEFRAVPGGAVLRDHVLYRVPGGTLGKWLLGRWIRKDIERIFEYRLRRVAQEFGA